MRRCLRALIPVAAASLAGPASSGAQEAWRGPDLSTYEWTAWLSGEWTGWQDLPDGSRPYRQSFELVSGGRIVLTRNDVGASGDRYTGVGIFRYDPREEGAVGQWWGSLPDTAYGVGTRSGDTLTWQIERPGTQVTRVRTRVGWDRMLVTNQTRLSDGRQIESSETLRRTRRDLSPTGAAQHVFRFIYALDHQDPEAFLEAFAPDAVLLLPYMAEAQVGAAAIRSSVREELGGPDAERLGLRTRDLTVRHLSPGVATASWHSPRPSHVTRYSALLERRHDGWTIVNMHVSSVEEG